VTVASIVITNHDHGRFVAQAIDSALAQTHAAVEVVVVDDGSTDDSRRIIEGYHDAVRVLFREHGGQARAMMDGFQRAAGRSFCSSMATTSCIPTPSHGSTRGSGPGSPRCRGDST
jgi:glycosyltransferase involved in cell wall biosynthesis